MEFTVKAKDKIKRVHYTVRTDFLCVPTDSTMMDFFLFAYHLGCFWLDQ